MVPGKREKSRDTVSPVKVVSPREPTPNNEHYSSRRKENKVVEKSTIASYNIQLTMIKGHKKEEHVKPRHKEEKQQRSPSKPKNISVRDETRKIKQ